MIVPLFVTLVVGTAALLSALGTGTGNAANAVPEVAPGYLPAITRRIASWGAPKEVESQEKLRLELTRGGFAQLHASEVFTAMRLLLALALPFVLVPPFAEALGHGFTVAVVVLLAAIGYMAPMVLLQRRIASRKQRLLRAFPDGLDLLVSCVEAGLSLDAALRRVGDEMATVAPDFSQELRRVNQEIAAGVPRLEALRRLGLRTGLDEIRSLVNLLVQSDRFGTAIARSLRVHATTTRQKRMSHAEEEAAKVAPKLTVVMVLFLLPCLFVIVLGPAAINIRHTLLGG
jgi:tight adherence protein C